MMIPACVFWVIPDISPIHRSSVNIMSVILHNTTASPLPNNNAVSVGTYYLFGRRFLELRAKRGNLNSTCFSKRSSDAREGGREAARYS